MNKAFKFISLGLCTVFIALMIFMLVPPKTLDFRGAVTAIETTEKGTVLHIKIAEASYTVLANDKTRVSYCCKDDPDICLSDIKIGDTIEGNYRALQKKNLAKFITVQYHN